MWAHTLHVLFNDIQFLELHAELQLLFGQYFGFPDVTMDIVTQCGHVLHPKDSAHQAMSNDVNIKSVAEVDAELLTSKPGSATNFIPN